MHVVRLRDHLRARRGSADQEEAQARGRAPHRHPGGAVSEAPGRKPLEDAEARRRIKEDLDATLIIEAAAGTGKTTTLISRVVELVRRGRTTLDRVVAVTFTDKAAGEMKLRLRAGLEQAREAAEGLEREHLDEAIRQLETARISTIHALCADLLRERPIEAGVDPRFQVGADGTDERLFDQVFTSWYRDAVEGQAALPGVRRVLRLAASSGDDSPRETLRKAGLDLAQRRDYPAAWSRPDYERATLHASLVSDARQLARTLQRAGLANDPLNKSLYPIADFIRDRERLEQVDPTQLDDDATEAALRDLDKKLRDATRFPRDGRTRFYAKDLPRQSVVDTRDAFAARLGAYTTLAEADIAASLQRELVPLVVAYQALKEKAGVLDFLDLLLKTRDLLVGDADVRRELQERFDRVLIDEFQDTNPLQAEILLLLTADDPAEADWREVRPVPGKLFVVGDPKQSIYRFRRADVALYEAIKARLAERGAEVLHLSACFRLVPGIAGAVNAAFAPVMVGNATRSQVDYVALSPVREEPPDRPSVIGLPVPEPFSNSGNVTKGQIAASYPEAVGAFVAWLVDESGWTVESGDRGPVPLAPQHVCLLFRRMNQSWGATPDARDLTRAYTRALEKRGVPHVLVGGHAFHARPEVLALRNALTAVEWPDDELSIYATLRGPLFGVTDDMLLVYRRFARLAPLEALARAAGADDAPPL
ncbi:MAG: ATP-dependent deoxyribonuclease subunit A, partial [Deltaproteobacteria bacterium]